MKKNKQLKINVDSVIAFAKLNYLRDLTTIIDGERLVDESWEQVKDDYISEAKFYLNEATKEDQVILTEEEVDNMINCVLNSK